MNNEGFPSAPPPEPSHLWSAHGDAVGMVTGKDGAAAPSQNGTAERSPGLCHHDQVSTESPLPVCAER